MTCPAIAVKESTQYCMRSHPERYPKADPCPTKTKMAHNGTLYPRMSGKDTECYFRTIGSHRCKESKPLDTGANELRCRYSQKGVQRAAVLRTKRNWSNQD